MDDAIARRHLLSLAAAPLFTACSGPSWSGRSLIRGRGDGVFDHRFGNPSSSMRVFYRAPIERPRNILFVMAGRQRNSAAYRDDWEAGCGTLILAPEFDSATFSSTSYNLGNMVDGEFKSLPKRQWSFGIISKIFDRVAQDLGGSLSSFDMFGHSAGAQFVHRFRIMGIDSRLRRAVTANAGWYTMPDPQVDFPFGLKGSGLTRDELRRALESDMVVLLGAEDTDPDDESLRRDREVDRQGRNRLARGQLFYQTGLRIAEAEQTVLGWTLDVVPGVAHDHTGMAEAAARLLSTTDCAAPSQ